MRNVRVVRRSVKSGVMSFVVRRGVEIEHTGRDKSGQRRSRLPQKHTRMEEKSDPIYSKTLPKVAMLGPNRALSARGHGWCEPYGAAVCVGRCVWRDGRLVR
jgi:hypothetical protein